MAYNNKGSYTAGLCEAILTSLSQHSGANNPMTKRTPVGYVESLISPFNFADGVQVIPVQVGTKLRQVRIKYMTRATEDIISDTRSEDCTFDYYDDFVEETVTLQEYAEVVWALDKYDMRDICESPDEMVSMTLQNKIDALIKNINKRLLAKQALNFGTNIRTGSAAATDVQVLTSTSAADQVGLQDLIQDYTEYNQYAGTPILVGSGNIARALATIETGCCNQEGVDMLALSNTLGFSYFLDTTIQGVLGSNQFAILAPGTTHFLGWNEYEGYNVTNYPTSSTTTIVDPRTGLDLDFKLVYDDCKEKWFLKLSKHFDLFTQPADAMDASDELYGTTGTLRYTATKAS